MPNRPQAPRNTRPPQNEPEEYDPQPRRRSGNQRMGLGETVLKSLIRSIASSIGRTIVRTIQRRMR